MFTGFPEHWTTLKKLMFAVGSGIAGAASGIWKTVTGSLIHITDALASPMRKCEVTLEPIQDLHGQDAPYPAGGGKNKWASGDKTITGSESVAFPTPIPAGDWTFSCEITSTTQLNSALLFKSNADGTGNTVGSASISHGTGRVFKAVGIAAEAKSVVMYSANAWNESQGQTTTFSNIQLETGTTATAYAPYSNICPITGWTGCEVNRTGVNVWDEEVELGSLNTVTGEEITSSSVIRAKHFAPVVAGAAYGVATKSGAGNGIWMLFYDANKEVITEGLPSGASRASNARRFDSGYKFIAPTNCAYVRWYFRAEYGTTYLNDTSINYSTDYATADTTYHPYQGTTLSVTFPDTVYGGSHEFVSGGLTDKYGIYIITGSESFSTTGTGQHIISNPQIRQLGGKVPADNKDIASVYTPFAKAKSYLDMNVVGETNGIAFGQNNYILIGSVQYNSWSDFVGMPIVYELAEPIEIQLTPQEISTLKGENNVWGDGDIELTYKAQAE